MALTYCGGSTSVTPFEVRERHRIQGPNEPLHTCWKLFMRAMPDKARAPEGAPGGCLSWAPPRSSTTWEANSRLPGPPCPLHRSSSSFVTSETASVWEKEKCVMSTGVHEPPEISMHIQKESPNCSVLVKQPGEKGASLEPLSSAPLATPLAGP
eukprot:927802-Pelagomonas_calceolata.AAC.3